MPSLLVAPLLAAGWLAGVPAPALAQQAAVAEALFKEGKALLRDGDYAKACPKLAESQRIDPSSGTLLNLALCQRKAGNTASAWATYLEAARLARQQKRDEVAKEAQQKAEELEPDLSYLTIVVAAAVPELTVRRDDITLEASSLGSKLPVDPGQHTVVASAPGYESITLQVTIGASRDAQTLNMPVLKPLGATPAPTTNQAPTQQPPAATKASPPPLSPPPPQPKTGRKTAAYVIGAGGLVATAVGATFGALALSSYADAEKKCQTHTACSDDAMTTRERAGTRATIANVGIGVGVIALATSGVLLLTSDGETRNATARPNKPRPARLGLEPVIGNGSGGLSLTGAF